MLRLFRKAKKPLFAPKQPSVLDWQLPADNTRWQDSLFVQLVREGGDILDDRDYPDFCLFVDYTETDPWHYFAHKLYLSGGNRVLEEEFYDWGQTYDKRSGRNLRTTPMIAMDPRIPATVLGHGSDGAVRDAPAGDTPQHWLKQKTKFCAFVSINNFSKTRTLFVELLSRHARVDAAGHMLRNRPAVSPRLGDKPWLAAARFYRPYKFVINFENSLGYGYTSEKLWTGLFARAVPIYWGNPRVGDLFHPERFINAHDFDSLESLARHVLRVHADDELYLRYLSAPIMTAKQRETFFANERRTTEFRDNLFAYIRNYPTSLTQQRVFQREILSRLQGRAVRTLLQTHRQHTFRARNFRASNTHIWPHRAFYDAMEMPQHALPEG